MVMILKEELNGLHDQHIGGEGGVSASTYHGKLRVSRKKLISRPRRLDERHFSRVSGARA